MTRDDIIRLAREAGLTGLVEADVIGNFERFAALVAAAEREARAKVCEQVAENVTYQRNSQEAADKCADAIRARGEA